MKDGKEIWFPRGKPIGNQVKLIKQGSDGKGARERLVDAWPRRGFAELTKGISIISVNILIHLRV